MGKKIKIDYTDNDIKEIIRSRIYKNGLISTDLKESKYKNEILCNRVKSLLPTMQTIVRHGQMFHDVHMLSPDFMRTNKRHGHLKFIINDQNKVEFGIKLIDDEVFDIPESALCDIEQKCLIDDGLTFQLLKDTKVKNIEIEYTPIMLGTCFSNTMSIGYNTNLRFCAVPDVFLDWIIFDICSFTENFYQWVTSMSNGEIWCNTQ